MGWGERNQYAGWRNVCTLYGTVRVTVRVRARQKGAYLQEPRMVSSKHRMTARLSVPSPSAPEPEQPRIPV